MNQVPTTRRRVRAVAVLVAVSALSAFSISNGPVAGATEPTASTTTTIPSTTSTTTPPTDVPTDVGVVAPPQERTSDAKTAVAEAAPVVAAAIGPPAVTVTPTSGLNPAGGSTVSVTGTGFDPNANSKFGVYAVFGPVDPATYFSDANRFLAAVWLHPGGAASGSPGQGELNPDGTFATTLPPAGGLPLTAAYTDGNGAAVNCMTTQCYVVTMAAHGVADRSQDTCTPVSFAGGTATPAVDRSCRPVATPAGQPTAASPNGDTGANGAQPSATGTSRATLPNTGSRARALGGLGLALLAGGLMLVRTGRRTSRNSRWTWVRQD